MGMVRQSTKWLLFHHVSLTTLALPGRQTCSAVSLIGEAQEKSPVFAKHVSASKQPCMMGSERRPSHCTLFPCPPCLPVPFKNLVSLLTVVAQGRKRCGGVRKAQRNLECDRYVHYFDFKNGYTGVHVSNLIKFFALNM